MRSPTTAREGVAALAAALACALGGAAPAAGASAPPTRQQVVRPFDGSHLAPGWSVSSISRGTCQSSLASPRRDAFRCFGPTFIHDPCFAPSGPRPAWVACVEAPWRRRAIRFDLAAPLPRPPAAAPGTRLPWVVQLVTGAHCWVSTGANGVVHGRVALYYCGDGGALAARVHETAPRWWDYRLAKGARSWQRAAIARAWF